MTSRSTRQIIKRLAVAAAVLATATACFLRPSKKEGRKSASAGTLIDRQGIFLDRLGEGESARIQFKTNKAAHCELSYYAQQAGVEPSRENPKVVACSDPGKARSEFTERIDNFRSDSLYTIVIRAWAEGDSKDISDYVTIEEPSSDGKLQSLWLARLNIPLQAAEVHRHTLETPYDIAALREKLSRKLGCQSGIPDRTAPFRDADAEVAIKNLATRDFASASATMHPEYPGRLQLNYANLNDGLDKWSLIFSHNSRDYSLAASPISRIVNMEMSSTTTLTFDEPQLAEAVDPLTIDMEKPLKFSWTVSGNLLDLSYVTVQIGRPENDKAIYCVFAAKDRLGVVDASFLKDLEDGKQVVLAELVSNQVWLKYGWIITTYDWRSGRIEK